MVREIAKRYQHDPIDTDLAEKMVLQSASKSRERRFEDRKRTPRLLVQSGAERAVVARDIEGVLGAVGGDGTHRIALRVATRPGVCGCGPTWCDSSRR